ncbi:hypothetical protein PHLGIDRAFT_124500, partial [Phlebiopsis gigantea 11061_1 CR5-6]
MFPLGADEITDIMHVRDALFWPGAAFTSAEDTRRRISISTSFTGMSASFCARVNCLQAECFLDPWPTGWETTHAYMTDVDNEEFKATLLDNVPPQEPCGLECFLLWTGSTTTFPIDNSTDSDTLRLLDYILGFAVDELPCKMSELLQHTIPCYLIFLRRSTIARIRSQRERDYKLTPTEW